MKCIEVTSLEETGLLGEKLGSLLHAGSLITLQGDLGAGKTTFTKSIGKALGVKETVNSPTFTIQKSYMGDIPLYHIDAYRLEGITQDLGFDELFEADGVCVIEWAQFIEASLPQERLAITIERLNETSRNFCFVPMGKRYEKIVEEL